MFVETFLKMESKLIEFGMGCLNASTEWDFKVVKFHAVTPKRSQQ